MIAWLEENLQERLFPARSTYNDMWTGAVVEVGSEREVVPFRFAGLDFWCLFLSPHAEADHDPGLLRLMLETVDVNDFFPCRASRLIKFCRVDAEQNHFKPGAWHLPSAGQIFQFMQALSDVMRVYLDAAPEVDQFLYLPASEKLGRLYHRVFKALSKDLGNQLVAILPPTGVCHAYQRTY